MAVKPLNGFRLAQEFNSGSAHDRMRLGVAQALCQMYDLFASESLFLSDAARAQLKELSIVFMCMYGRLSVEAIAQGIRMWMMIPNSTSCNIYASTNHG